MRYLWQTEKQFVIDLQTHSELRCRPMVEVVTLHFFVFVSKASEGIS